MSVTLVRSVVAWIHVSNLTVQKYAGTEYEGFIDKGYILGICLIRWGGWLTFIVKKIIFYLQIRGKIFFKPLKCFFVT